jgi:hypothetical protein
LFPAKEAVMKYKRIEVLHKDCGEWVGPGANIAALPTPLAWDTLTDIWGQAGLHSPPMDGLDVVFGWTNKGWNDVGCGSFHYLCQVCGMDKVRIVTIQGEPCYEDELQVAIPTRSCEVIVPR